MYKIASTVILLILWWRMIAMLKCSPFPEGMYHATDMATYPGLLEAQDYKVKLIPDGPIKRTPLKNLMKLPCEESKEMDVHYFNDYGRVAVKKRTYTESHFPEGKYYATTNEYDKQCTCPILYKAEWETWHVNNRVTSPEIRETSTTLETTKITDFDDYYYLLSYENTHLVGEHDTGKAQFKHPPGSRPFGGGDIGDWNMYRVYHKVAAGDYAGDQIYDIQIPERNQPYKVVWSTGSSMDTPLVTLDYLINVLYEKYQWVQWRVYPGSARRLPRSWMETGRRICYIETKDLRGIRYNQTITVPMGIQECNIRNFINIKNSGENGLRVNFVLGNFHRFNESLDYLELETYNEIILWEYEVTDISQQVTLQVDLTFGPIRESKGHIWAIINRRTIANKYHFNYLLPEHWLFHRTKFAIAEHGHMCDYRELIKYAHQQQDKGRPLPEFYSGLSELLIEFGKVRPEQRERIFSNTGQCRRAIEHEKCTSATGPLTLAMVRPDVTPDLHNNQSILAYGRPCFLNTNESQIDLNRTKGTLSRNKRFIFALLFSAMMGGIVENDMKNYIDTHLKTYNRILNERIQGLAAEMNSGFCEIQDQLRHVREAQNQLETQVHMLAIVTENYHQMQERTNRVQYAVDKQLLENTVANTKAILETRQIALTEGNEDAKRAILNFHLHRRILLMLRDLRPVRGLMNYTVYKTNIRQGIMENEALYWFGKNETEFIKRWNNTDRINAFRRN